MTDVDADLTTAANRTDMAGSSPETPPSPEEPTAVEPPEPDMSLMDSAVKGRLDDPA
jgi:hypothetical protein